MIALGEVRRKPRFWRKSRRFIFPFKRNLCVQPLLNQSITGLAGGQQDPSPNRNQAGLAPKMPAGMERSCVTCGTGCWERRWWQAGWAQDRLRPRRLSSESMLVDRQPIFRLARVLDTFGWQDMTRGDIGSPDDGPSSAIGIALPRPATIGAGVGAGTVIGAGTLTGALTETGTAIGIGIETRNISAGNSQTRSGLKRPLLPGGAAFFASREHDCSLFRPVLLLNPPVMNDSFPVTAT